MVIQHNVLAANAQRQYNITGKRKASHAEKLSSGYRINRAADDAAGLAISEKMRRQIRGLTRGTANAEEGISYVQTADGAMNEVHEMLQRMNELTIQSLNGTLSDNDREYLNDEFTQLRTEIDRVNTTTKFNDQRIFEDHESAYWSIIGNRRWSPDQGHIIPPEPQNAMNIHMPEGYVPKDYTLTVPAGKYTTQELIDEIDTALENLKPSNPGFVFEYTKAGYCRLNLEGGNMISSVDGPLSYLLFDTVQGMSSSSILGTTEFKAGFPLEIVSGKNDTLGFFVEKNGNLKEVSIEIPAGNYSRTDMIKLLNKKLAENPASAGVVAKEYGTSGIQITGGNNISITGLNGNMFKMETVRPYYNSVFYDNVKYGGLTATGAEAAYIAGGAYYNSSYIDKIHLVDGKNNVLSFKTDSTAADYTTITLTAKDYTISDLKDEIEKKIKELKDNGIDINIKAEVENVGISINRDGYSTSATASRLKLTNSDENNIGSKSELIFKEDDTYDALFRETGYFPIPHTGKNVLPKYTGTADLSGAIELPDNAELSFTVGVKKYTINGISKNPTSLSALVGELNGKIDNDIKGKVKFDISGSKLVFGAETSDVRSISFTSNPTYEKLFCGKGETYQTPSTSNLLGGNRDQQGGTGIVKKDAQAFAEIPNPNKQITIEQGYSTLSFYLSGYGTKNVSLSVGSKYNGISGLADELNRQFRQDAALKGVTASVDNGSLKLTATPSDNYPASDYDNYSIYFITSSSAWGSIVGKRGTTIPPDVASPDTSTLTTYNSLPDSITIDGSNDKLTLTLGNDTSTGGTRVTGTLTLAQGTYGRETLKKLLNDAIAANTDLNGKVTADWSGSKLQLSSNSNHPIKAEGRLFTTTGTASAYNRKKGTDPTFTFDDAYISGRKDLSTGLVEIVYGANDKFTFDFTCKPNPTEDQNKAYKKEIEITIPEGKYDGSQITAFLKKAINDKFAEKGITDFDVNVGIGIKRTPVVVLGSIDDKALQIVVSKKAGSQPVPGQYIIDGIRGTASGFLFYKTDGIPTPTYVTGSKRLPGTIKFEPSNNVLTMDIDDKPYKYTFPTDKQYTTDEFIDLFNDMFKNGDDNGNTAPIRASLENGNLRISHRTIGSHTITNIGGSARSYLFLEEEGRNFNPQAPLRLQVSDESNDTMDVPRMRVGSTALAIHSVFISKPKYAEKALRRIGEAITMMGAKRGTYGAIQNRLEHLVANNNNIIENTTAAESRIRDADMAKEMVGFSISSILAQAGETMLAQANQSNQGVMTLLG